MNSDYVLCREHWTNMLFRWQELLYYSIYLIFSYLRTKPRQVVAKLITLSNACVPYRNGSISKFPLGNQ